MANSEFKLPHSSFSELQKLLVAFAKSKTPSSLGDLNKLTGIHKTLISSNNGFLESINAIQGGNSKEATPIGKKLGLAIANNMESEIELNLKSLLLGNDFIESMITALEIKPRSSEDFQSHLAYSLGKELKGRNKTGAGTLVDLLLVAKLIEEKESVLYAAKNIDTPAKPQPQIKVNVQNPTVDASSSMQEAQPDGLGKLQKNIVGDLGGNVSLNINIQLTIPETENEKVYENFFKAMKKHLLS